MAVGFTPKFVEVLSLGELAQNHFIVLLNEAAVSAGWVVNHISNNGLIAHTNNGMLSWNAEVKIVVQNGAARIESASTGNEMMDWGKNRKTVTRFISLFYDLKQYAQVEQLEEKYQQIKDDLIPDEQDVLLLPPTTTSDQIGHFFSLFKPKGDFFITPILMDLNILIFISMAISGVHILSPDNESLLNWGANFRPMTLDGQWWRLLTNIFLHIGIIHLLMNIYALLYVGILLEPILGRVRFLAAYLFTGVIASLASLWWHDLTISAGASGAIFGLYGVFLALLTTNLIDEANRKSLLTSIGIFIVFNLLNGLKGGIDNAAHIGGLLAGVVVGFAFIPAIRKPDNVKLQVGTIGVMAFLLIGSTFIVFSNSSNDIGVYQEKMKKFVSLESMALEVYQLSDTTSKEDLLYEIEERGIYYWNENIKLLDSFENMNLPVLLVNRNKRLKEYCQLRIKCYDLIYKTVAEDTEQYNKQIETYNKAIEDKIEEIKKL